MGNPVSGALSFVLVLSLAAACSSSSTVGGADPGGGAGAGGSTGAGGNDGGSDDVCKEYCELMAPDEDGSPPRACPGELLQYDTPDKCLAVCRSLPVGSDDMETGNSVFCRLRQARLAAQVGAGEAATNCAAAGPSGNGLCGEACDAYCELIIDACDNPQDAFTGESYNGVADCTMKCPGLPVLEKDGETVPFASRIFEGNSLQCRLWHVQAAVLDPTTHCGHSLGAAPCDPGTSHSIEGATNGIDGGGGSAGAAGAAGG